jgi:hypothetical protein
MNAFKILIDDMRNDGHDNLIDDTGLPPMDLIIRTPVMFQTLKPILKNIDFVLFLDHDLGLDLNCHYNKNGYQILMEMFDDKIYPLIVKVITSNPVGRQNIYAALRAEGYSSNGIGEWTR